jgi:hypothetical protein
LLCMTSSLLHSRARRWPRLQSRIIEKSPNAARRHCRSPTPHNITNLCRMHSIIHSLFIEPDTTSASALLLSIRITFIGHRLHQAGCSR